MYSQILALTVSSLLLVAPVTAQSSDCTETIRTLPHATFGPTSTKYTKTHTVTETVDCNGCSHVTAIPNARIGIVVQFTTTITASNATTTFAYVCSNTPTGLATSTVTHLSTATPTTQVTTVLSTAAAIKATASSSSIQAHQYGAAPSSSISTAAAIKSASPPTYGEKYVAAPVAPVKVAPVPAHSSSSVQTQKYTPVAAIKIAPSSSSIKQYAPVSAVKIAPSSSSASKKYTPVSAIKVAPSSSWTTSTLSTIAKDIKAASSTQAKQYGQYGYQSAPAERITPVPQL